jgi:hypothetical protein
MTELPRVWVTGMWGFEPEKTGYVGFTAEAPRNKYIRDYLPGDLMMIIGQRGEYSEERDVGRVLGIVELEPIPIRDTDRMSQSTYQEKCARGWRDRWTYALPILRAWKTRQEVKAKYVAPITCSARNARAIGSNALLLESSEVDRLMGLPLRKVAIYGVPSWIADGPDMPETAARVAVSHGPPPSFGTTNVTKADGENKLYIMELAGQLAAVFPKVDHHNYRVLKIGRTNDEKRRHREMNCGFPPGCELSWRLRNTQTFPSAADAHKAEQGLLRNLERQGYAIGGEFAVVPERRIAGLLASVSGGSAFLIRA